jgi:type II secretory pathway pseudopilin PulG
MICFRKSLFLFLFLLLAATACSRDTEHSTSVPMADVATQVKVFSADAWLRDRLPADTIAYLRIPSPWRVLTGPGGKDSDRMFQSQAYVAAIDKMRKDMAADGLSGEAAVPLMGLLYRLGSPVEIATIAAGRLASPATNVYATLILDYPDSAALGVVLGQALSLAAPPSFDAEGYAELALGTAPSFLHFDTASKRLSILGGMYANLDALKALRKSLDEAKVGPQAELALEREIDAGGHGLVLWADIEALRPILGMAATDEYARMALDQVKRVAIGWGSVDGHGRISVRAQIAGAAWTRYLPQAPRKLDLKSSGPARVVFGMAWPTADDIKRMQQALEQDGAPETGKQWAEADGKLVEFTGLHITDWFAPFGPDLVVFSDNAGEFLGLRVHDAAAFKTLLTVLQDKLKAKYQTQQRNGQTIHHLRLPSMLELAQTFGEDTEKLQSEALLKIYARLGSHLYWIEQDGWLLLSGVPQPLMDRAALGADQSLEAFVRGAGGDPAALFTTAGQVSDVARQTYYGWLGVITSLADLGGAEFDLMALPTARELALPQQSALAANLQISAERVQLDLNYAQHPMEFLSGSDGMTVVAVAGILAAIAIPAYQDYVIRAEVASAIAETAALKLAISEQVMSTGKLPADADTLGLGVELPMTSSNGKAEIDFDHGAILVRFGIEAQQKLAGSYLYLLPLQDSSGNVRWRCGNGPVDADELMVELDDDTPGTNVLDRYLPAACRAN